MAGELLVSLNLRVKARSEGDARAIAEMLHDELAGWLEVTVEAADDDQEDPEGIIANHGDFTTYLEWAGKEEWKEDEDGKG